MAGLEVFEKTTQLTQEWINEVAKELGDDNKQKVFQGLRATLHTLRDRLTIGEASHLGAALPILLAGFYYENWKPESTPVVSRSKEQFLNRLHEELSHYFPKTGPDFDVEQLARAVFKVMTDRIPAGAMQDVTGIISTELKDLFPEQVRT